MAAQIKIDQVTRPAGTAGKAREDLVLAQVVTLTASGGPFMAYQWRIIHKPIDIVAGTQATALLSAPAAAVSQLSPIDVAGTYLIELTVNSGFGMGATVNDVARITFYAGTTLAVNPKLFPRRIPAFQETNEHNVNDAIDATGNTEGWSREWYRWFAAIQNLVTSQGVAWAKVLLPAGGPATQGSGYNIATTTRTGVGVVDIVFTAALPNDDYAVTTGVHGTGGMCLVLNQLTTGFRIERSDPFGVLVDDGFSFDVTVTP